MVEKSQLQWLVKDLLPYMKIILCQTYSLAGLGAGVTEAIIVNPFEVVKVRWRCFSLLPCLTQVRLQSNRAHQSLAPSTW